MVYKGLKKLGQLIFPPTCVLCGMPGTSDCDLCDKCESQLPRIKRGCCRCGLPLADSTAVVDERLLCGRCLQRSPYYDRILSPLSYEPPVDWLVQRLKFNASLSHIRVLSVLLMNYLVQAEPAMPDLLLPVPLHPRRMGDRGFNQALELARPIARCFSLPLATDLCQRCKDTPSQSALPAGKRAKNMRKAFSMMRIPAVDNIAIVDDVVTTGATVDSLARLLKKNGVKSVQVWAVARTPLPN